MIMNDKIEIWTLSDIEESKRDYETFGKYRP